jgi:hypothetical protein
MRLREALVGYKQKDTAGCGLRKALKGIKQEDPKELA